MKKFNSILLVEDDPIAIIVCDRIIKLNNFTDNLITKENGKEALKYIQSLLQENKPLPEVILLDINMPIMNGWDFLNEYETLLDKIANPPMIFILSSTADPNDFSKTTLYNFVKDFIPKPFNKEHLSLIESYCED